MERNLVGYRFSPTGEEVINYYLKSKILDRPWLVNEAINEINICAYDPEFLPSLSKLESKDLVWYFFTPREYHASEKKKGTKRTTPSGFWKATGKDRIIRDKRGHGVGIGIKKTLVYHHGKAANGVGTPWVMHEYHTTSLPLNQRNYVICQVMYKGAGGDSLYGNNSNALSHSTLVSDLNTDREINTAPQDLFFSVDDLANPLNEQDDTSLFNPDTLFNDNYCPYQQPQAPSDDDYIDELLSFNGGNYDDVLRDPNITMHRNDHRPKKALTKLSLSWSYGLRIEAVTSAVDSSTFAVLALVPKTFRKSKSKKNIFRGRDGAILLFNGSDPKPVSIWTVMKAQGGSISFLEGDKSQLRLAFVNGSHEYVVFDPSSDDTHERSAIDYEGLVGEEETGDFGYTSLYGQLPDYDKKRKEDTESLATPFISSERPWETIFSGSTLNFPPLQKLCGEFFESLMEKSNSVVE